ncbi:adenylyltransferase/cytidyltransferase family protein [Candidatus Gottesmanbacteria bacterium]|nr:adenylyltransferase/cytidyltransferase family protein [Candidatus Gottesmanbacteria bacterium]
MNKVIAYKDLSKLIKHLNYHRKVLVGGVFDLLHLGHIRFLREAAQHGFLLVALESDESVKKFKGTHRPFHTQVERAEMLSQLETVDFVILLPPFIQDADYFTFTQQVKPTIIAVTEGDPQLANKQKQAVSVGGQIVVIPKIASPSTTQLAKLLQLE